jgi:hypothetical protein
MTVAELKQQFVDYLYSMDKNKMSIMELNNYVFILKTLLDTEKADPSNSWMDILKTVYAVNAPVCAEKEVLDNG